MHGTPHFFQVLTCEQYLPALALRPRAPGRGRAVPEEEGTWGHLLLPRAGGPGRLAPPGWAGSRHAGCQGQRGLGSERLEDLFDDHKSQRGNMAELGGSEHTQRH